jgi:hypothetical protein
MSILFGTDVGKSKVEEKLAGIFDLVASVEEVKGGTLIVVDSSLDMCVVRNMMQEKIGKNVVWLGQTEEDQQQ